MHFSRLSFSFRHPHSMGSVNLVVIVESARSLITKSDNDLQDFHLPSIIAVSSALGQFLGHIFGVVLNTRSSRQIYALRVLLLPSEEVKSSPSSVGRSSKRFVDKWIWYVFTRPFFCSKTQTFGPGILMSTGGSKLRWCKSSH